MSVIGIDFGNLNVVAGVPRGRGIDIVTSTTSHRQLPALVSFQPDRRVFGDDAASQMVSNRRACYSHIPTFIGQQYDDVKDIIEQHQFKMIKGKNGECVAPVYYAGEPRKLSPTQLAASVMSRVVSNSTAMTGVEPNEVLLSVPGTWGPTRRRRLSQAAEAAGLKTLDMQTEHMAAGMAYWIKRVGDLTAAKKPVKLALLSLGASTCWFAVLSLAKDGITTLSAQYDHGLGGRQFDEALLEQVIEQATVRFKMSPGELREGKALAKLRKAARNTKKGLSTNSRAPFSCECVGDRQVDIFLSMQADEFAARTSPLVSRVQQIIEAGLTEAGLKASDIDAAELIGGASRIHAVRDMAQGIFKESLGRRLNADEAIAVGLAWIGAVKSPRYRFPYNLAFNDRLAGLTGPVSLVLEGGPPGWVAPEPKCVFQNGAKFPSLRKVPWRLPAGKYKVGMRENGEGGKWLERVSFEVTSPDLTEVLKVAPDQASESVLVRLKVQCDSAMHFKVYSLKRQDVVIEYPAPPKPEPKPEKPKAEAKAEAKEEAPAEEAATSPETNEEEPSPTATADESMEPESVPVSPEAEADEPMEPAVEEPVEPAPAPEPRVRHVWRSVPCNGNGLSAVSRAAPVPPTLLKAEAAFKRADQDAAGFDSALNSLESLAWSAEDDLTFGDLQPHATPEEVAELQPLLLQTRDWAMAVEGPEQLPEIKQRFTTLTAKMSPFHARRASFRSAEQGLRQAADEAETMRTEHGERADAAAALDEFAGWLAEQISTLAGASRTDMAPPVTTDLSNRLSSLREAVKPPPEPKEEAKEEDKEEAKDESAPTKDEPMTETSTDSAEKDEAMD
eukprot:gnl/Dysnectes_brevis/989_a1101_1787.p1 GENE.gnl/Dysnectes_brevis/989_a1101_1787~~gnl/Dysnectes_brevis/989_a1101_1787.p1  ORF type:complete len:843 (+),score=388.01 gnl/Dysnectes_brevis/989_a1101_1787:49-2577(+)